MAITEDSYRGEPPPKRPRLASPAAGERNTALPETEKRAPVTITTNAIENTSDGEPPWRNHNFDDGDSGLINELLNSPGFLAYGFHDVDGATESDGGTPCAPDDAWSTTARLSNSTQSTSTLTNAEAEPATDVDEFAPIEPPMMSEFFEDLTAGADNLFMSWWHGWTNVRERPVDKSWDGEINELNKILVPWWPVD